MKKLLTLLLTATLLIGLPSLSMAGKKGKKGGLTVEGEVTAVTDTSITVQSGKKKKAKTETISVPAGTSVKDETGATVALSSLSGKHVTVTESSAGTASNIVISAAAKKGKKKSQ
jgi:hypothetical protein